MRLFLHKEKFLLLTLAVVLLLSIAFHFYSLPQRSLENIAKDIKECLDEQTASAEQALNDENYIETIAEGGLEKSAFDKVAGKNFILLVYNSHDSLIFWNSNKIILHSPLQAYQEGVVQLKNGWYKLVKKEQESVKSFALIPVKYDYSIQNKYLENKFAFPVPDHVEISEKEGKAAVKDNTGQTLFFIYEEATPKRLQTGLILIDTALLILLLALLYKITTRTASKNPVFAFGILAAGLILMKVLIGLLPFAFKDIGLFDPQHYASPVFADSLGDLLISILFFFWLIAFFYKEIGFPSSIGIGTKTAAAGICIVILFAAVHFMIKLIKSLVIDSAISFEIENILSLSRYSFIGLLCITFLFVSYFLLSFKILKFIATMWDSVPKMLAALALVAVLWSFFGTFIFKSDYAIAVSITLFIFAGLLYLFIRKGISFYSYSALSFWLIFFAVVSTMLLNHFNHIKEFEKRKFFAQRLAVEQDPVAEYLLQDILEQVLQDKFIEEYFTSPTIGKKELSDRIENLYFGGYFSKFQVNIYTFNADELPYKERSDLAIDFINEKTENSRAVSEQLFYNSSKGQEPFYIAKLKILKDNKPAGYLVLEIIPKVYRRVSVYPELLLQEGVASDTDFGSYSFAIYKKGQLVNKQGSYSYSYKPPFTVSDDFREVNAEGYSHLAYKASASKIIIVSKEEEGILHAVSLFSYQFCFLLFVVLLLLILAQGQDIFTKEFFSGRISGTSFRNRIQFAMIFIILLSFIVIGVVTVKFFTSQYNVYHKERLTRKASAVLSSIEYILQEESRLNWREKLQKNIEALSDVHSMDINLYGTSGNLILSSRPGIFEKGLISRKIAPKPFLELTQNKRSSIIETEQIGSLRYLSAYVPVQNNQGELIAYLNLPYFAKQKNLEQEISSFLVALINVYVLLLLGAGFLALLISNSITRSLDVIRSKLQQVRLGRKNEPIEWHSRDEIGILIHEYNKMIRELEASADKLAKSERESAWREMAKQVAHEVKNPLTPMKLSIQHLQRAHEAGAENINELTRKITSSLIEQIDTLARIASEFSSFAQMPAPENEELRLEKIIDSVTSFYKENEEVEIITDIRPVCIVYADKNRLIRVLNNLITNAVQAIPEEKEGRIKVKLLQEKDQVLIAVEDNGTGIPEAQKDKVFEPNFTTKSSGTGLGLAMAKNIIESAGGEIWFESHAGEGTVFYVKLPCVKRKFK